MRDVRHALADIPIFALTYLLIRLRRLKVLFQNRPSAALTGTMLMVVTGAITPERACRTVGYDRLVRLRGMMRISAYLHLSGFFGWRRTGLVKWQARRESSCSV